MAFDHELKLGRAVKHLEDLRKEVANWVGGDHHTVRYEFDPQSTWAGPVPPGPAGSDTARYFLAGPVFIPGLGPGTAPPGVQFGQGLVTALASAERPPSDPISLLIGDTLHNLRSALDNLAYSLASAYTQPLSQKIADASEFPIFGDEDRQGNTGVGGSLFNQRDRRGNPARGSGLSKIEGWDPGAQTVVEGLQPYKQGKDFRTDPLWILHELDRLDKHRLLHTTVAAAAGTLWDISAFRNIRCIGPGFVESCSTTIETDTSIGRICGVHLIDPSSEMHVEIRPVLFVAFTAGAPVAGGQPVVETLAAIYNYIATTVIPLLASYL